VFLNESRLVENKLFEIYKITLFERKRWYRRGFEAPPVHLKSEGDCVIRYRITVSRNKECRYWKTSLPVISHDEPLSEEYPLLVVLKLKVKRSS